MALSRGYYVIPPGSVTLESLAPAAISDWKTVQAATTGPLPTNTATATTLSASADTLTAIDGVDLALGDRVLVKNEVDTGNNGIYALTSEYAAGVTPTDTTTVTVTGVLGQDTGLSPLTTSATVYTSGTPSTFDVTFTSSDFTAWDGVQGTGGSVELIDFSSGSPVPDSFAVGGITVDISGVSAPSRTFLDGETTASTDTLISAGTANFTPADIGAQVLATGVPGGTEIITFFSSSAVQMSNVATASATGLSVELFMVSTHDLNATANGDAGTPNTPWVLTRAADMDSAVEFNGSTVNVLDGTANLGTKWFCNSVVTDVGTDAVTFSATLTGASDLSGLTDVAVTSPTEDQVLTYDGANWVNADATGGGGSVGKYTTTVGDAVDDTFTVTHSLASLDVQTTVYDNTTGEVVYPTVTNATTNTVTVAFATVPDVDQYRVVVLG